MTTYSKHRNEPIGGADHARKGLEGTKTSEEGAGMTRFCQSGEQVFAFQVVFMSPKFLKLKLRMTVNDLDKLGYGPLVTAGQR